MSPDHLEEAVEVINRYGFKYVNIASDYQKEDIDFLKQCSHIEVLDITNSSIKDYDGLKSLKELKGLGLKINHNSIVDIGNSLELEGLVGIVPASLIGLEKLKKLTRIQLFGQKTASKSLLELAAIPNLEELIISQGNIETLSGTVQPF